MDTAISKKIITAKRNKTLVIIAIVVIAIISAILLLRSGIQPSIDRSEMTTAVVEMGSIDNTLNASGEIIPEFEQVISSPINASIKEVNLDAGSTVKAGESLLIVADLSEQAGILSAQKVLNMKPRPDGLFITNDFVAAVCMRTLKEAGIRIPQEMAIVGFNNDAIGKLIEPALTTINYPGIDMGEIAARNLVNHLQGTSNLQQTNTIIVRSELIVRKSSLRK